MRALGVVAALLLAVPAAAAPPREGVLVPGRSLGGVELGATRAQVTQAWGARHGRCRNCKHTTWYFNYDPYAPQGIGVELRRGRAVALFTVWGPSGWSTPAGLRLGDPAGRIDELYGPLERTTCRGYSAFHLARRAAVTSFYVDNEKVWAFGLSRPGIPLCR